MNIGRLLHQTNAYTPYTDKQDFGEYYVQRWDVNGKVVKWFQRNHENFITIFENNVIERVDLLGSINATDQIHIEGEGSLDFCPVRFQKKIKNVELSLLLSRFGLIWQLFDRTTKKTKWQNFSATFVSDACHRKTWDMFEKFKEEVQENIGVIQDFEQDFIIRDIVLLKEAQPIFSSIQIPLDLESKAEEERKKACDLKKERTWKTPSKEMIYASMNIVNDMLMTYPYGGFQFSLEKTKRKSDEDPDDLFVFGGTKRRFAFEEKEKRFAIYNTIIRNPGSIVLGHEQKSQLSESKRRKNQKWIDSVENIDALLFRSLSSILPIKKHLLVSAKIRPLAKSIFPFYVIVEPRTVPCTLDANVRISKLRWAVSLICVANNAFSSQHAEIVVQGINDGSLPLINKKQPIIGERFTFISHLREENEIDIDYIEETRLRFTERTNVWLLTSKKIKKMLLAMAKEKKERNTPFSILGAYSPFGRGHSCITWALSYLNGVGIDLGWPAFGFFFTQTKSYTQKPEYYFQNPEYQKI